MGLILIHQFHPQVQFFKLYPRRRKLAASAQFKIQNSEFTILSPSLLSHLPHNCPYIPSPLSLPSLLSLPIPPTSPILPTRPTCRPTCPTCPTRPTCPTCPTRPTCLTRPSSPTIHNSKFIIPLALFRAHYRLEKRLYLWCIKKNSSAILLYCIDC